MVRYFHRAQDRFLHDVPLQAPVAEGEDEGAERPRRGRLRRRGNAQEYEAYHHEDDEAQRQEIDHGDPHLLPEGHLRDIVGGRLFGEDAAPDDDVDEIKAGHDYTGQYARNEKLSHVDIGEAREHNGKGVRRDEGIDRADAHKRAEAHALAVAPV